MSVLKVAEFKKIYLSHRLLRKLFTDGKHRQFDEIKGNGISVLILVSTKECLVSDDKLSANAAQVNYFIHQY